jgi:hypothetical protein
MLDRALLNVLNELVDGAAKEAAGVLNPEDPGILKSLDALTAEEASAVPAGGGSSVAAHVEHLRYGLELLNRWSRGEEPFADADYSASWRHVTVSEAEWASRREALRREAYAWREAIAYQPGTRTLSDVELTGVISSIAHLAYHLGAIRQIHRATRGPSARD